MWLLVLNKHNKALTGKVFSKNYLFYFYLEASQLLVASCYQYHFFHKPGTNEISCEEEEH